MGWHQQGKGIYHSASFWGRANAWYFLALVDILEVMPKDNTYYSTFKGYLTDLAAGIANYQDKDTGCWYQVMDKVPASLTGNYLEASCSSIFTAGYLKAIRLGLLDKTTYEPIAKKAYEGLVNQFMIYDNKDNSTIQLVHSCTSAGLGGSNNRAGDDNYYLTGKDASVVTSSDPTSQYYYTEGKVLGGFIMAATEYERAYQNQDSKQILFAKDLAPSYNFTTTEGKLDATAYGSGDVTYQWYKDDKAIANAKSATYAPTEGGSYYCIATDNSRSAGSNTIQTSTTVVTTANTNTDNGSTDNNGGSDNGTATGNIFSYTFKTSENTANTSYTAEGGTVTLGAAKVEANGFKSDGDLGSTKYILVSLNNNTLQEGDVIKISAYSSTKGKGGLVAYTGTTTGSSSVSLGNMTQKSEDISYTVKASDILNGLSTFYIYRKTGETTYVKSISITRANTQVALTASFSPATISATEGDAAKDLPTLTVKAGETTLTAKDYTVTYASDNNAVAKVENGKVSFVGKGETNIVATIKPTDTNKYKETSATFAVKVEKKQTPVTPTEGEVIYDFTGSIGTTTDGTSCTTANNVITFSSNFSAKDGKYITIKPNNGGFKAGDVITLKGYCNSKNLSGVIIYSDVMVAASLSQTSWLNLLLVVQNLLIPLKKIAMHSIWVGTAVVLLA